MEKKIKISKNKNLQKKASKENVKLAQEISKLPKLKTFVDKLMSSVNKSTKKDVKDAADELIKACKNVANKLGVKIENEISEEEVKKFSSKEKDKLGAYETIVKDLAESSNKKEQKLVTSMSNAFPHWCLSLAQKLQDSNFYKRLSDKNNEGKDNGETFDVAKKEENKGVMYELKKKYKNLFSGKARKHETFNKMKNLVVKYSEPWAIAWVNAAGNDDSISESSAIEGISKLCKEKDLDFITDLGDKDKFKLAESFTSIFGANFKKNSGKIKKSLKSIIDRLVSISKKLGKGKYSEEDKNAISEKIKTYNKDAVFKAVMAEPGILSKAWGKITTAASTVGGGIKTAGGKVLGGAKAVGSGIATGAKLLGKGALAAATSPKYLIPSKWRDKIYDKLKKIFTRKTEMDEIFLKLDKNNMSNEELKGLDENLDMISNSGLKTKGKQEIILNNIDDLTNTNEVSKLIDNEENENENEDKE